MSQTVLLLIFCKMSDPVYIVYDPFSNMLNVTECTVPPLTAVQADAEGVFLVIHEEIHL